uniref:phosphatidylserine lipase ABHD16A-like isoform X2 n=1 Tax=Oncorhynchus gorbuscha TaxID=8017 RepID=UPI001EAF2590|nr:phosphatidylserine lipase ABHD16A-like isoform X2 [Oncorhynchus gorbuscha]
MFGIYVLCRLPEEEWPAGCGFVAFWGLISRECTVHRRSPDPKEEQAGGDGLINPRAWRNTLTASSDGRQLCGLCHTTAPLSSSATFTEKWYICSSKLVPVSQYVGTVMVCLLGVAFLRGWGRWRNSEYQQFISILEETRKNHTPSNKKKLACYDFDFSHWPADFSWEEVSNPKLLSKAGVSLLKPEPKLRGAADSVLNSLRTLPCHIVRT